MDAKMTEDGHLQIVKCLFLLWKEVCLHVCDHCILIGKYTWSVPAGMMFDSDLVPPVRTLHASVSLSETLVCNVVCDVTHAL